MEDGRPRRGILSDLHKGDQRRSPIRMASFAWLEGAARYTLRSKNRTMSGLSRPEITGDEEQLDLEKVWVETQVVPLQGTISSVSVSTVQGLATATLANSTLIVSTLSWNVTEVLPGSTAAICDNSTLVCSPDERHCIFYDSKFTAIRNLTSPADKFGVLVALSATGSHAVVASARSVFVYRNGLLDILEDDVEALSVAIDETVAIVGLAGEVRIYEDLRLTSVLASHSPAYGRAVALGPDGLIIVAAQSETFLYTDLKAPIQLDSGAVSVSANGAGSIALGQPPDLLVYRTGQSLATLRSGPAVGRSVAASHALILASEDNFIIVFSLQSEVRENNKSARPSYGSYILLCVLVAIFCSLLTYYKKRRPYDDGTFCPNKARAQGRHGIVQAAYPDNELPVADIEFARRNQHSANYEVDDIQHAVPIPAVHGA